MADSKDKKPGIEAPAPKRRGRPPGKRSIVGVAAPVVAKAAVPSVPVRVAVKNENKAGKTVAAPKPVKAGAPPATPIAKAVALAPSPIETTPQPSPSIPAPSVAKPVGARAAAPTISPPETEMTESENFLKNAAASAEATTAKVTSMFNDLSDRSKSAMTKGSKLIEEYADLTKGNLEAVGASSRAAAKGAETLAQSMAEYGRKNFEDATKAMKSLTSVKSPTEVFQLQSEFAKSAFDSMVSEASRVSETVVKIWGDVMEPLSSRAAVASDKVRSAIK